MKNRTRTPLIVLAALIFASVLGGAIYGAIAEPKQLDASSPEGVVQAYMAAVFDDDQLAAVGFMTDDLAVDCRSASSSRGYATQGTRVFLDKTNIDGDTATVDLDIRHSSDGLDEWTETQTIWLESDGGVWMISEPPWPYWDCVREGS